MIAVVNDSGSDEGREGAVYVFKKPSWLGYNVRVGRGRALIHGLWPAESNVDLHV